MIRSTPYQRAAPASPRKLGGRGMRRKGAHVLRGATLTLDNYFLHYSLPIVRSVRHVIINRHVEGSDHNSDQGTP